jgi:hypothetical protein
VAFQVFQKEIGSIRSHIEQLSTQLADLAIFIVPEKQEICGRFLFNFCSFAFKK